MDGNGQRDVVTSVNQGELNGEIGKMATELGRRTTPHDRLPVAVASAPRA